MTIYGINDVQISGVVFAERFGESTVTFSDHSGALRLGDCITYDIESSTGRLLFEGRIVKIIPAISSTDYNKFIAFSHGTLGTFCKLKSRPTSVGKDVSGETPNESYKLIFAGSSLQAGISIENIVEQVSVLMTEPAIRLTKGMVNVKLIPMPVKIKGVVFVAMSWKQIFNRLVKPLYTTYKYRTINRQIEILNTEESIIHSVFAREFTGKPRIVGNLLESYSNVSLESNNIQAVYDALTGIANGTEGIKMPSFFDNYYHESSVELSNANTSVVGFDKLLEMHILKWDDALTSNANVHGGQDIRHTQKSTKGGEVLEVYDWDYDLVQVNEAFGKAENTGWDYSTSLPVVGVNDYDYTDDMAEIVNDMQSYHSNLKWNGSLALKTIRPEIRVGDRINLPDTPYLSNRLLTVTGTKIEKDEMVITIGTLGADYIDEKENEIALDKARRQYEIKMEQ